jgi:hypothetical protein
MLPASFQTPAAVILLVGGLISCFAGYRVFRVVLGIYGFVIGALFASGLAGPENTFWMIAAALAGGVVGALILIAAYFVGVALLGAGIGALGASLIWAAMSREPSALTVILFSIAGALAALALTGNKMAVDAAARSNVWLVYPTAPAPGNYWILLVWLALGVTGVIVQLALTAKGQK